MKNGHLEFLSWTRLSFSHGQNLPRSRRVDGGASACGIKFSSCRQWIGRLDEPAGIFGKTNLRSGMTLKVAVKIQVQHPIAMRVQYYG
jgi:hypothetical protein